MNVGIVSLYPPMGETHSKSKGGVASYSKNLASSIIHNSESDVIVFADKLDNGAEDYVEDNVLVVRCWKEGVFFALNIIKEVFKHRKQLDVFHLQHEYFLYGNIFAAVLFPFLVLLLRLTRKPVIVTLHGIISLAGLDETFRRENGLNGNPLILRFGLKIITKLICYSANSIVIHECHLKKILIEEYNVNESKVMVIPHGIEEGIDLVSSDDAKEKLNVVGKKVVMFFGYISGYKGLHTLIDAFVDLDADDYILVVAGGEHPRLQGLQKYEDYVESLRAKASNSINEVRFTGFVPAEEVSMYFAAADVVVLPYTTIIASSGPFALCIAYERPFILSNQFGVIVNQKKLLFKNDVISLRNKIEEFFTDSSMEKEGLLCCKMLFQQRSWSKVGKETANLYRKLVSRK